VSYGMTPELLPEDIDLYLRSVVIPVEVPSPGRDGRVLFRCPVCSQPPHDISMDPNTGKWFCLGGTCGRGNIFDYHWIRFKMRTQREAEAAVVKIVREAREEPGRIFGRSSVLLLRAAATEVDSNHSRSIVSKSFTLRRTRLQIRNSPIVRLWCWARDPPRRDDGLLQAREIRDLRLKADLVRLSACDTGAGRLQGQERIASLERAFLYAGARSVVASL